MDEKKMGERITFLYKEYLSHFTCISNGYIKSLNILKFAIFLKHFDAP